MRQNTLSRILVKIVGLIAVAVTVSAISTMLFPADFWGSRSEYAYLSLSHALNLQQRIIDRQYLTDPGLFGHPGIPFYVASWLSLRAAALVAGATDVIGYGLTNANQFYFAARTMATLITVTSILFLWQMMRDLPKVWRVVAIASFFACVRGAVIYSFFTLGNETFALPIFTLLSCAIVGVTRAREARAHHWLPIGFVAGLAYTVKLLYLNVFAAALVAAVVDAWLLNPRLGWSFFSQATQRLFFVVLGFVCVSAFLLYVFLGVDGTHALLKFHLAVYSHDGRYGSGDVGVVSGFALFWAFYYILFTSNVIYLLCAVAIAFGAIFWRGGWDRPSILCGTAAAVAMATGLSAILKHYAEHYLPAIGAALPLAFYVAFARASWRWVGGLTIAVAFSLSLLAAIDFLDTFATKTRLTNRDEADILKLPLAPGEARLWVYPIGNRNFAEAFVAFYSGISRLTASQADPSRTDFSSYAQVKREYRYILLDKSQFPLAETVQQKLEGFLGMKAIGISPRPDDKIYSLRQTLVVKRADQPALSAP